jgi:hypothetical protein
MAWGPIRSSEIPKIPLDLGPIPATLSRIMNSITRLTAKQLRQAANLKERIDALEGELNELLGSEVSAPLQVTQAPKRKRRMSAAGRRAIAAAARARWAKYKADKGAVAVKPRRKISAAGKARLSALAKARWKKVKALGKSRL